MIRQGLKNKKPLLTRAGSRLRQLVNRALRPRQDRPASRPVPKQDEWSIGIYFGSSPFNFEPDGMVQNPVITRHSVSDVPASYVADPFMVHLDDTWYMFFEVLNQRSRKGEIGYATSRNGTTWAYGHIVLAEPFHLSYPHVFRWEREWYLVPESCAGHAIRLYRADPFPTRWVHVKDIIPNCNYVDPSLVRFDGRWWLFAGSGSPPRRAENLHVLYADELTGEWTEHPCSPVVHGNARMARPGGRMIWLNDSLIRYTQDCATVYGGQVRACVIKELTCERYVEETSLDRVVVHGSGSGWNAVGMHHVDAHPLSERRWIACVDGWRWSVSHPGA